MNHLAAVLVLGLGWSAVPAQALPGATTDQPARAPEDMRVTADGIDPLLEGGEVLLLDVREPEELEELGTRPGYINIPIGQLEGRLNELPRDRPILTA